MKRDDLLDSFRRSGALLEGHFRLSSGLHSTGYLQCALVLQHPADAEKLGRDLGDRVRHLRPNVVLSPALGGVVIGHEVARALGVRSVFVERQDGMFAAAARLHPWRDRPRPRGRGRADDRRIDARNDAGGDRGWGAGSSAWAPIVDRSGGDARFDVPYEALLEMTLPTYQPDAVSPLCEGAVGREAWIAAGCGVRSGNPENANSGCTKAAATNAPSSEVVPTFKLTLAYDGTEFVGWQRQASGVSIQGLLENACSRAGWPRRCRSLAPAGPMPVCTRSDKWPASRCAGA